MGGHNSNASWGLAGAWEAYNTGRAAPYITCAPHTLVSTLLYEHDGGGQRMGKNGAQACWLARQHSNGIARDCTEGSI